MGEPVTSVRCAISRNASLPCGRSFEAKWRDSGSCSALKILTANTRFCSIDSLPRVPLLTHTSISGGSSETDEKAFAVSPYECSGPRVVTTVTPVANALSAERNSRLLNACAAIVSVSMEDARVALYCSFQSVRTLQTLLDDRPELF